MNVIVRQLWPLALLGTISALAQTNLVVPNAQTYFAGNAAGQLPGAAPQTIEYQQLLGAGQFHSSPITITQISFRAAPGTGPLNGSVGSLTVTLSTSPSSPNTNGGAGPLMSTTYANNVGSDKTVVFSGNSVPIKDAGCAAPGPCPFDITLVFQKPFVYNPTAGPLLMDLQETNLSGTGTYDSESFSAPGGSVASVEGPQGNTTGTFMYQGLVVQVTYTSTAPAISGVVNVASNIPPGMPNYGIAQGSLFAIYGSGIGGANLTVAQLPLPTSGLGGTSVNVTVSGTQLNVPLYFTRGDIVVGVMPSNMPTGNGTLVLNYNNGTATYPVSVVPTAFGLSYNPIVFANSGIGIASVASVTFENYVSVTPTNTAKPGDTLTLWGTGLGATPNSGGDTTTPPAGNIGPAPQVFVGGVASPSVLYWGRSPGIFPGLDQINFVVPPNAPLGCNVSVVVQTANPVLVSNGPTISLAAADGSTCSDPTAIVPATALSLPLAKILSFNLNQFVNPNGNGPNTPLTSTYAEVFTIQVTNDEIRQIAQTNNVEPSFGSCSVGINANPSANGPFTATLLDAGPSVTLTPPSGQPIVVPPQVPGDYKTAKTSVMFPSGIWNLTNGKGGADVGALNINIPVPAQITWTNQAATVGATITRTSPYTITWTGGDASGYVDIQGSATVYTTQSGFYSIGFECAAPTSAGSFTIPPSILMAMPPGAGAQAAIQVSTFAIPHSPGNAPGFDVTVDSSQFQVQVPVIFK
jgi:uncharacterized protein (TIGR03437 family)